jgi:3-oxosteroid 1-dehydrogenase
VLDEEPSDGVDLIVVGSGAGGLLAALAAHEAGLKAAIFEKAAVVGGGTAYSGGVVWAPCNQIMARKGIHDSVEDALEYLAHAAGGRGDELLARRYVENVGAILAQVEAWTGIKWIIWPGQPDYYPRLPGARVNGRAVLPHPSSAHEVLEPAAAEMPALGLVRETPHMDFVPGFQRSDRPARAAWVAGRSIIGGLWKAVLEREIPYTLSARVRALLTEDKSVVGVEVEVDGIVRRTRARHGVVLNTGGFDWDRELARRYLPGPRAGVQTPPSNTGDGHRMAMALGAATALLDEALWHPSIMIPGDCHETGEQLYRMFNAELAKPHCVLVNACGQRFTSEAAAFAVAHSWFQIDETTRTFPNLPCYFIADDEYRQRYGMPGVREGDEPPGWITQASTLPALAAALGIDEAGLLAEVALYNDDCRTGVDTRFRRGGTVYELYWGDTDHDGPNATMGPVASPPFHAFPVHLSHAGTRGGLVINGSGQVKRIDGRLIQGLYACGNTAANLLFGAGYGAGSAVGSSMVFGYLAGQDVARRAASRSTLLEGRSER